jgi:hypothetical protein
MEANQTQCTGRDKTINQIHKQKNIYTIEKEKESQNVNTNDKLTASLVTDHHLTICKLLPRPFQ